jgi:hypothetical protein
VKTVASAIALLVITVPAFAGGKPTPATDSNVSAVAAASASARTHSAATSSANGGSPTAISSSDGGGGSNEVFPPDLAGLVGTNCSQSATMSGAGSLFALAFGATYTDADCNRRETAKYLADFGYKSVAFALLCQNSGVPEAARAVGVKCPGTSEAASVPTQTSFGNGGPYDR